MFSKADYEVQIIDDVFVVTDLDKGGISVTNDIENVLQDLSYSMDLGGRPVIYRDSMGRFDGVNHILGRFVSFSSLNETNVYAAVAKVKSQLAEAS